MPLKPGKSNIGPNIRELEHPSTHAPHGRPYAQALAIALKTAGVPRRAAGGHVGPLTGATGGRADKLPVSVPNGSHVLPADVVSALGEGNSSAGHHALGHMFPGSTGNSTSRVRGGKVPIMASDGEFVVSPEDVVRAGKGDPAHGHRVLDAFIKHVRAQNIQRLKRLPGPSK